MAKKETASADAKAKGAKKAPAAKAKSAAKKSAAPKVSASSGSATVAQYAILRRPIVTEKSAGLSVDRNRVVFEVARDSTKVEIKAAIEAIYGVKVARVRTVNVLGKVKRAGTSIGRRPDFKKAYITLKEGQTIDVVEGL